MPDEQGRLAALGTALPIALRRSVAVLSVLAALWLLFMSATTLASSRVVVLAVGYLAGGALLLSVPRWSVPAGWTAGAAAFCAVAGTGSSLLVREQGSMEAFSYTLRRGYPLHVAHRTAAGESLSVARANLAGAPWRADWAYVAADLLFWGYCGLAAAVLITVAARLLRTSLPT